MEKPAEDILNRKPFEIIFLALTLLLGMAGSSLIGLSQISPTLSWCYILLVILLLWIYTAQMSGPTVRHPGRDPIAISLSLCAVYMLVACIVDGVSASATRRAAPWLLPIFGYLFAARIPAKHIQNAALICLIAYALLFWQRMNSQIYIMHVASLAFLLLSNSRLSNSLYLAVLIALAYYLESMGAVISLSAILLMATLQKKFWLPVASVVAAVLFLIKDRILSARSIVYRLDFWDAALQAFKEHPLSGVGPGKSYIIYETVHLPHAHNMYLSLLAETGLSGSILFFALIVCVYRKKESYHYTVVAALAGLGLWHLVDEPLYWAGPLLLLGILLGKRPLPDQPAAS